MAVIKNLTQAIANLYPRAIFECVDEDFDKLTIGVTVDLQAILAESTRLETVNKLKAFQTEAEIRIDKTVRLHQMQIGTVAGWALQDGATLQPIAKKLQAWRVVVVNKLLAIQAEVQAGTRDINTVVFDDEWVVFDENNY